MEYVHHEKYEKFPIGVQSIIVCNCNSIKAQFLILYHYSIYNLYLLYQTKQ